MLINYIIGPAGSGKSTLTNALLKYVQNYNHEITTISLNLDPAVEDLPYEADIDIRDYIDIKELIEETGLGPNGAIIEAADRTINFLDELKFEIMEYNNPEMVFVDTPGQMELFSFRNTGPLIASALGFGDSKTSILFCYDAKMCTHPNGLISTLLLSTSVQFRFPKMPILSILTKMDTLPIEKLELIMEWVEKDFGLEDAIGMYERGMLKEFSLSLERVFREFGAIDELLPVSAKYNTNIDELYANIQRAFDEYDSPYM